MTQPRFITLSGSYYEQGRQHGDALAGVIGEILDECLGKLEWRTERVRAALARLRENTERHAPPMLEELRGLAAGSGQPEEALWAYNCLADVWQVNAFCTTLCFPRSPDGPLIGKTNDVGRDLQKYHAFFHRTGGDGPAMLWVTWPGSLWANAFVTESGLGFGAASVVVRARNEEGMPSNLLLRWFGERAATVDEAIAVIRETPIMHHPPNIALADASGRVAVVEKSPLGTAVREVEGDGALFATNHFCTPELCGTDAPGEELGANSRARYANLARLTADGAPSVARMKEILADHHQPGGICQHGQDNMWTTVAYVVVPARRAIHFTYGRPCEVPFVEYRLGANS